MDPKILLYSADENITFGGLKNLKGNDSNITVSELQKIQDIFIQNDIQATIFGDVDYHPKFHAISSVPYIVHYMGDLSLLDRKTLGIVGPRKASNYSHQVLQSLFDVASDYDFVTISGMAEGVDQLCHAFSIKHHIPTIAVLGGGINHYLKGSSRYILDTIVQNGGLILSEYKINFYPTKYSFPQRNRIVAGLCDTLFLPEAGEGSGSLITAEFAYQRQKPIYVAPNNIFSSHSTGVHQLIADHKADIFTDFRQIFSKFPSKSKSSGLHMSSTESIPTLSDDQNQIVSLLHNQGALSLSHIIQQTRLDSESIMAHLTMLEINNYIYESSPGLYSAK